VTILGLLMLAGLAWGAFWLGSRQLRALATPCRHERTEVLDGEIDICWSCGIPIPREEAK
jgi:hypothetical protein